MRCFIAAPLPQGICDTLQIVQDKLRLREWKQTFPKHFHLTFAFYKDISEEQVAILKNKLAQFTFEPIHISLTELGAFPHKERPRVIWAGVQPVDMLQQLHAKLHSYLGQEPERELVPHITLSRVKSGTDILPIQPLDGTWELNKLVLYKSTLTPQGSVYEELAHHNL